jgi:hypothetical protein
MVPPTMVWTMVRTQTDLRSHLTQKNLDGLEDTDNQEPETEDTSEEDNETDDSDHAYEEDDSPPLVVRFPKSWNATRRDHAYAVINAMRTVTYEVMYKDAQWEETWAKWLRMSNEFCWELSAMCYQPFGQARQTEENNTSTTTKQFFV